MYFCYIDDSGDSRVGSTMSALLVEDKHWNGLLKSWLEGRRRIHTEWGVGKNTEIHANKFLKGRGSFCDTPEQDRKFGKAARAAASRVLLRTLADYEQFRVVSFGMATTRNHELYKEVIAHLDDWARSEDTYVVVFYDGLQGFKHLLDDDLLEPHKGWEQWTAAARNAAAYRRVHRSLDIADRRVLEDVLMQDSRYSQLIQAVDLIAYCSFHKHLQDHPEIWGDGITPLPGAAIAFSRLRKHWLDGSDQGMIWWRHP
ncbi:DUF3800 domain-containing protein [Paenarthrobacter sp. NPDC018779]|uniref:DUF3800 domain-containing protein n=1 Tax=Paenarthrobacter sp. NPDC018779 TaxID=3364375 RepID=UPI0037C54409